MSVLYVHSVRSVNCLVSIYTPLPSPPPPQVTHHHFSTAAEPSAVVVGGDDLELEVGPAHVPKHDGRLNDTRVGLDDEAVLALLGGRNNQAVRHLAVIPRVLVSCLCRDVDTHESKAAGRDRDVIERSSANKCT